MELDELKDLWSEYDRKLDKSLRLNRQLLRQLNLDKARSKLRKLMVIKILELAIQFVTVGFLIYYAVRSIERWMFLFLAIVLIGFVLACTLLSFRQINIILQLKLGYSDAIAPMQKKLEKLKILVVQYVKMSYLAFPISPLFSVLGADIWFNYDFFLHGGQEFWTIMILLSIASIPFISWIHYQLSQKEIKPFWVKNFLDGSGWSQITHANNFLKEIDNFEKED
jgi:hypothetical protein